MYKMINEHYPTHESHLQRPNISLKPVYLEGARGGSVTPTGASASAGASKDGAPLGRRALLARGGTAAWRARMGVHWGGRALLPRGGTVARTGSLWDEALQSARTQLTICS